MRKKKRVRQGLLIALMTVIALIIVFPVYVMVISSFKYNEDIFSMNLLPKLSSLTLDNYITVFTEENLGLNIWNSFFVATIVTVVALYENPQILPDPRILLNPRKMPPLPSGLTER